MAQDRFVEAVKKSKIEIQIPDRVPRTDKVRTYFSTPLYSKESDMKTVIANRDRAFKSRRRENTSKSED